MTFSVSNDESGQVTYRGSRKTFFSRQQLNEFEYYGNAKLLKFNKKVILYK